MPWRLHASLEGDGCVCEYFQRQRLNQTATLVCLVTLLIRSATAESIAAHHYFNARKLGSICGGIWSDVRAGQ